MTERVGEGLGVVATRETGESTDGLQSVSEDGGRPAIDTSDRTLQVRVDQMKVLLKVARTLADEARTGPASHRLAMETVFLYEDTLFTFVSLLQRLAIAPSPTRACDGAGSTADNEPAR